MQHRMINNKFTVSLVFSLLAMLAASAIAGNQPRPQYSLQMAGGSLNPWALPQTPEKPSGFQPQPWSGNQPYQNDQSDIQYPGFRFVTPEILESLKQQQMQTQQVPPRYPYRQYSNRQYSRQPSLPPQLMSEQPVPGYYGAPSQGMGFANPLYDTPAVSPWGSGPDVIYRGQSFPGVPDAAIGGIPPMNVTPFIGDNAQGEAGSGSGQKQNNVFNPFTFGSNGNL